MEFIFVLLKVRQGSSDNETTKTVTDESQAAELGSRAWFSDVLMNLICELLSHIENATIGVLFVSLSAEEQSIWKGNRDYVLEDTHVKGWSLETMTEYE
jgi:hypothetical protein